ncbi:hypothetical protein F4167_00335 [Candidatus Poribacteria bacterium]|nr:hypothetical protein [Candidatus Poribacteria bacterium]
MRKTSQMNSRNSEKFKPTPPKFSIGTLMILFAITGCSDMPYTGSTLTVHEVDRYLVSTDGNAVCFQDDLDATCIKLTLPTGADADTTNGPDIYIYPERRLYIFYHEGKPVVRAERVPIRQTPTDPTGDPSTPNGQGGNNNNDGNGGNTSNNNGGNTDNNGNNNGGNTGNNGNNNGGSPNGDNPDDTNGDNTGNNSNNPDDTNDGHGWIIWIYYPEGAIPQNPPTLSESGVTVTINGKQLADEDITGFAQFISLDNEVGVQFFYPTQSAELLDLKVRMEGIIAAEDPVKFNINYLWDSQ